MLFDLTDFPEPDLFTEVPTISEMLQFAEDVHFDCHPVRYFKLVSTWLRSLDRSHQAIFIRFHNAIYKNFTEVLYKRLPFLECW